MLYAEAKQRSKWWNPRSTVQTPTPLQQAPSLLTHIDPKNIVKACLSHLLGRRGRRRGGRGGEERGGGEEGGGGEVRRREEGRRDRNRRDRRGQDMTEDMTEKERTEEGEKGGRGRKGERSPYFRPYCNSLLQCVNHWVLVTSPYFTSSHLTLQSHIQYYRRE